MGREHPDTLGTMENLACSYGIFGRIQDAIYMQKLQPALRAYLQKLREEAYIFTKPGYVDSGASPNQTQPIETTAKDATAKQLKKKKKFGVF